MKIVKFTNNKIFFLVFNLNIIFFIPFNLYNLFMIAKLYKVFLIWKHSQVPSFLFHEKSVLTNKLITIKIALHNPQISSQQFLKCYTFDSDESVARVQIDATNTFNSLNKKAVVQVFEERITECQPIGQVYRHLEYLHYYSVYQFKSILQNEIENSSANVLIRAYSFIINKITRSLNIFVRKTNDDIIFPTIMFPNEKKNNIVCFPYKDVQASGNFIFHFLINSPSCFSR